MAPLGTKIPETNSKKTTTKQKQFRKIFLY